MADRLFCGVGLLGNMQVRQGNPLPEPGVELHLVGKGASEC